MPVVLWLSRLASVGHAGGGARSLGLARRQLRLHRRRGAAGRAAARTDDAGGPRTISGCRASSGARASEMLEDLLAELEREGPPKSKRQVGGAREPARSSWAREHLAYWGAWREAIPRLERVLRPLSRVRRPADRGRGARHSGRCLSRWAATRDGGRLSATSSVLVVSSGDRDRRGEGAALGNLGVAYAGLGQGSSGPWGPGSRQLAICPRDRRPAGRGQRGAGQPGRRLGKNLAQVGAGPWGPTSSGLAIAPRDRRPAGRGPRMGNLGVAYADLGQGSSGPWGPASRAVGDRNPRDRRPAREETRWATWASPRARTSARSERAVGYFEQSLAIARGDRRPAGQGPRAFICGALALDQLGRAGRGAHADGSSAVASTSRSRIRGEREPGRMLAGMAGRRWIAVTIGRCADANIGNVDEGAWENDAIAGASWTP